MKVISITGTPCTGKTTIAKKLSKELNYLHLEINEVIKENGLHNGYDKKRQCYIVDVGNLNKHLIHIIRFFESLENTKNLKLDKSIKKGIIIDSHLSHYLPKDYVDLCIVMVCDLKTLQKRLKKRKYSQQKISENMDAEIFDVCLNEAKAAGHRVIVISSTKDIKTKPLSLLLRGGFNESAGRRIKYNNKKRES